MADGTLVLDDVDDEGGYARFMWLEFRERF